jgi:hypothetical protein
MIIARITSLAVIFLASASAFAGTELSFWHSYVHAQTSETHHAFRLADFKRGLFWGSCGPSTKSLRWSFNFNLAGDGPVYPGRQIILSDDNAQTLRVVSGQVVTDAKRGTATIAIEIESAGATNKFVGNGEYRIKKAK